MTQKLTVGQTLWWVPTPTAYKGERSKGASVAVAKIGRKWATLSNGERIDLANWVSHDGDECPRGKCYLTEQAYAAALQLQHAWRNLAGAIRTRDVPEGVTLEVIQGVRRLLTLA